VSPAGLPTAVSVLVSFVRRSDVVLGEASFRRPFVVAFRRLLAVLFGVVLTTMLASGLLVLFGSSSAASLLLTVRLLVLFRLVPLPRLLPCSRFFETMGLALVLLLAALELGTSAALLAALEPAAHALFAPLPPLTVSLVLPTDAPSAALERGLLVALGLLTALLTLPPPALLTAVLLTATLLPAMLLVLSFGSSASLAPSLTLWFLSLVSVPVLVSLLRSSLSVPLLSASSLSALSVFVDFFGSFVLVVWHGRITLLRDAD
jgi:hypothetical protein